MGLRQRVEILKALYRQAEVLILDEPTAVLTPQETRELFGTMRSLAVSGRSVIFITHKLREVLDASDRVSVMRQGRIVATQDNKGLTADRIASQMVGRNVLLRVAKGPGHARRPTSPSPSPTSACSATAAASRWTACRWRSGRARSSASPGCRGTGRTSSSRPWPASAASPRAPSPSAARPRPGAIRAHPAPAGPRLCARRSGACRPVPAEAPSGRTWPSATSKPSGAAPCCRSPPPGGAVAT